ncbi:MAG: HD domain-containing protein, partial [Bacteriovoracaceae bacterium]
MQQDQSLNDWEQKFTDYLESSFENDDKSHDISHFQRVWKIAQEIMNDEADKLVILAGAYFHDIVCYPKNDPRRSLSSVDAGIKAMEILKEMDFPEDKLENVKHAIEAHSFSAGIAPKTIEAKVLQDADRMESLGALGLARTFYTAGRMGS